MISDADAKTLAGSAELLRACDHALRLVTGRSRKTLPDNEAARAAAAELTQKILQLNFSAGLQSELDDSAMRVREIYERLLAE